MNTLYLDQPIPLIELNQLPADFITLQNPKNIKDIFPHPTLIHLTGKQPQALYLSILMHGNETTGFFALQRLLRAYQTHTLPRSLLIFISNVDATEQGVRKLPHQPDYNRIWPGTILPESRETQLAQRVYDKVLSYNPIACLDIHNNTGKNPHYGCISRTDLHTLRLANAFSFNSLFFHNIYGIQSVAFSQYFPSITLECGKPGLEEGTQHTYEFIDALMKTSTLETLEVKHPPLSLYQTTFKITVPDELRIGFTSDCHIQLRDDIEDLNFVTCPAGTVLAKINSHGLSVDYWLNAMDTDNINRGNSLFVVTENQLCLSESLTPSMISPDIDIIRMDCLCYLMTEFQET